MKHIDSFRVYIYKSISFFKKLATVKHIIGRMSFLAMLLLKKKKRGSFTAELSKGNYLGHRYRPDISDTDSCVVLHFVTVLYQSGPCFGSAFIFVMIHGTGVYLAEEVYK